MKIAIIISWVVLVIAIIFYFVTKYLAKKKTAEIIQEQLKSSNITVEELQKSSQVKETAKEKTRQDFLDSL